MRLHRLTITGVGPFPGTETIDFDRFADSGRFLLTGPTGSGKTTIIDAIVFALYGEVADSDGSSKQRIRSTLVAPTAPSEVELVFSTSAGVYRVVRTPEYMRPKRRGSGTTKQNASVKLWRLSAPDGKALSEPITRIDEAGQEILRIVGLDRGQFTQTVILPQGKFAQFLRAESKQRRQLLRDVFGTGVFDHMQEALRIRGRALEQQAESARQVLRARAEILAPLLSESDPPATTDTGDAATDSPAGGPVGTAADMQSPAASADSPGEDGGEPVSPPPSPAAQLEALVSARVPDAGAITSIAHAAVQAAQAPTEPAQHALEAAGAARQEAVDAVNAAIALQDRLDRRARLVAEQQQLNASAAQDAADAARAKAARQAASVIPVLARAQDSADAARTAHTQAITALEENRPPTTGSDPGNNTTTPLTIAEYEPARASLEALTALIPATDTPAPADADYAEALPALDALTQAARTITTRSHALRTRAGTLSAVVKLEDGLAARAQEAETAQQRLTANQADTEDAAAQLAQRPELQTELEEALAAARAAQARVPELRLQRAAFAERLEASQRADALDGQIAATHDAVEAATAAARDANALVSQQREAWISATAGSIVTELVDGQPCPVCGSTEHPAPAVPDQGTVSRADVEAAEAAQRQADAKLAAQVKTHEALVAEQATARTAAGQSPTAQLAQALEAAQRELDSAQQAAAPAPELESQLADFTSTTEQLREQLAQRRAELAQEGARLDSQFEALARDRENCRTAQGAYNSVADHMRALSDAAEATGQLAALLAQAAEATRTATQARTELADAVTQAGFVSATDANAAYLPGQKLTELEQKVAEAAARRERVRHGLTQDEAIASLTGEEEADVVGARQRLDAAESAYQAAVEKREQARSHLARVQEAADAVSDAATALTAVVKDSAALWEVVAVASGYNDSATPLATWVLLERFKEVLVFANQRLSQMSAGRYELVHVDDEVGSRSRTDRGLGLGIIDRFSDSGVRGPKTLSGGETFYVSLSLALALADVVTAESGGVTMETLFIDEGFGSLDPETLQNVLAELGRLQAGGRTVGIVSHVEELRRQVADRIEVTRSPAGSRLRVIAS
ncbi:SMC family ATPase [Actinomyces sp. 594]|uniref:AAA family ATPase n=1 Tax=Actinomyces sp. 594 TaxID=2057793 RepID=UPI001C58D585|nr:SMC family ATPase [Actinomyces sp. 594]MBW3068890.1 SMC family ATPase [Actinomyces sp. 594]